MISLSGRAVLLDMDGTLVNSHAVVERVWREWALDHGLDPADVLPQIHGRQAHASMALLLPGRPHEENLADNDRLLAIEQSDTDIAVPDLTFLRIEATSDGDVRITRA